MKKKTFTTKTGDYIEIQFENINPGKEKYIAVNLKANSLKENSNLEKSYIYVETEYENTKQKSSSIEYTIGKPIITINQITNTPTYIKSGEDIEYEFTIKNEGTIIADNLRFECKLPENVVLKKEVFTFNNESSEKTTSNLDTIEEMVSLKPSEELKIKIIYTSLETNSFEYEVKNKAKITLNESKESNEIVHKVENSNLIEYELLKERRRKKQEDLNIENNIKTSKLTGYVWIDKNKNGFREEDEEFLPNSKVFLLDANTGEYLNEEITNLSGKYEFDVQASGNYIVLFEYDNKKFELTEYQKETVPQNSNSDVIPAKLKNEAVTEVIKLSKGTKSNVDMGLVLTNTFDLELETLVSKITVNNQTYNYNNLKLAKIEIDENDLSKSTANIEYTIEVKNNGNVDGYAKEIVDYMPNGLTFNKDLNPDWYIGLDGNLHTKKLANEVISKGEKKQVKLILTKQMTEDNTELINNQAEIVEDFNEYGLEDNNSKPGNKVEYENDFSSANVIISVKKGGVFIYASLAFTTILLGGITVFVIVSKLKNLKRKEGGV